MKKKHHILAMVFSALTSLGHASWVPLQVEKGFLEVDADSAAA